MADVLFIDTCGVTGAVWVISTAEPAVIRAARQLPGRETQERLMTAISEVLVDAQVTAAGLDALAVITGPGSFTGAAAMARRNGLCCRRGVSHRHNVAGCGPG